MAVKRYQDRQTANTPPPVVTPPPPPLDPPFQVRLITLTLTDADVTIKWRLRPEYFEELLTYTSDIEELLRANEKAIDRHTRELLASPMYSERFALGEDIFGAQLVSHFDAIFSPPAFKVWFIKVKKVNRPVPPEPPPQGTILIGYHYKKPVVLTPERREEHVYIVGRTRSGKTTLLRSMILQDIEAGRGVAIVDPHGDLAQYILRHIPEGRPNDTVLLSDECRIPVNIFRHSSEQERQIIASDVIALFKRFSDIPGARMDAILRFSVATLTKVPGATFLDLYRLLTDVQYRAYAIETANDPTIGHFWTHTFSGYPRDAVHPIISRLAQFRLSELLTDILGAPSSLDFYDIIQSGNIFIADLSKGKMTEDNSLLLGSIIVSQIQLAAMRRARLPEHKRTPFYLYVDEFQNFRTSSFPVILSEASKYGLHLTMAHQYLSQLDPDTLHAVVGNVGTRMFFALGAADAKAAQPYIGDHEAETLMNFDRGDIIFSPRKSREAIQFKTTIYEPDYETIPPGDIERQSLEWFTPQPEPLNDEDEDALYDAWVEHQGNKLPDDEPGPSSPPPD